LLLWNGQRQIMKAQWRLRRLTTSYSHNTCCVKNWGVSRIWDIAS
jgi:hypothetical protein